MNILSRLSLITLLIIAATLELLFNRIGVHVVGSQAPFFRTVDTIGLFFFYFTGLLALIVYAWGTVVMIRDSKLLNVPGRMALTIGSALFLPLATVGLFFRLPQLAAPHLNTAFGVLVIVIVYAFLARPAAIRAKLGVLYLAAPLLLHCYWLATQQMPAIALTGDYAELPSRLFEAGEHLVVVGAFASFLFFSPFPRLANLFEPIPMALAMLITGAVGGITHSAYPVAAQAAYYGLGLNLPAPSFQSSIFLAALFFFLLTIFSLFRRPGSSRVLASGLTLIALSGFQLQLPYQLLLTIVGLLLLVRGSFAEQQEQQELRERALASAPKAEQWTAYLRRIQARCIGEPKSDDRAVVVLKNEGSHVVRLRAEKNGTPLMIRVLAEGSTVVEIEIAFGRVPKEDPPAHVMRKTSRRGRRISSYRGPRVDFEPGFVMRDSTGRAAEMLSLPEIRKSLQRWMHGLLAIWPQEAVTYIIRPLEDGWPIPVAEIAFDPDAASIEEIEAIVTLLETVASNLEIH